MISILEDVLPEQRKIRGKINKDSGEDVSQYSWQIWLEYLS